MDYAIVTIRLPEGARQIDMELPVKMRVEELLVRIRRVLSEYDGSLAWEHNALELRWQGKILNTGMTMSDYQIWDGSVLDLVLA